MRFLQPKDTEKHWDLVVIGSGFGSLFFVHKYLARRPKDQVLILEWGRHNTVNWQFENRANSEIPPEVTYRDKGVRKKWDFTIGLGGSTNSWWALSPRMHPADFRLQSLYGKGVDWPVSYDDLVPYYSEAEEIMTVAGPDDLGSVYPHSVGYPQPPHRLTTVDRLVKAAMPDAHFAIPSARLSRPLGSRGSCCSDASCNLCPTGAKYTALEGMTSLLSHPNVSICVEARVRRLEVQAGAVHSATFTSGDRDHETRGDLFVLGANAIHSPFILQQSGLGGGVVGRYLGEKLLAIAEAKLDGLQHFDGGTGTTAINVSRLDGPHRRERGSAVFLFENNFRYFGLRLEHGRWREILPIVIYIEDVLQKDSGVFDEGGEFPVVRFAGFSDYAINGLNGAVAALPEILKPLPVDDIQFRTILPTLGHVQGTLRMGTSAENSVVDGGQVHHRIRNLVVVGTSVFPTTGSANIALTAAALSLRAADRL